VPKNTAYLLTKKSYYKIIYLKDIISLVEKEKGPAIHEKIEGALFNNSSISNTVNLSNHIFNKTSKISL
jgi:hypothetical protein